MILDSINQELLTLKEKIVKLHFSDYFKYSGSQFT